MADQDLDARLKQLQAILDERVTLLTKPPKPRGRRGRPDSATNSTGQRGMHAPSASSPAPILPSSLLVNQPGSMRKTQQPNRAAASGLLVGAMGADLEVLQKSEFRKGQSFQKDIAFCPWKTVLSYPGQYIGKANRPRVSIFDAFHPDAKLTTPRHACTLTQSTRGDPGTCEFLLVTASESASRC